MSKNTPKKSNGKWKKGLIGITTAAATASLVAGCVAFEEIIRRPKPKKKEKDPKKLSKFEQRRKEEKKKQEEAIKEATQWYQSQYSEIVEITSFDGLKLKARLLLTSHASDRYVLAIHGYRSYGDREYMPYAKFYLEHGFNLLIPDDRAHGQSEGKYIGMGYLDHFDCMSWIDYMIERFGDEAKIMLHGISMGAATVMITAGEELPEQVKAVIEDCGYTSAWEQFGYNLKNSFSLKLPKFPILPIASKVSRFRAGYDFKEASAIKAVEKTKLPMLFIHGDSDTFVPTEMVYKLFQSCNSPKELFVVEGAPHAGSYFYDKEGYEKRVLDFADRYLNDID